MAKRDFWPLFVLICSLIAAPAAAQDQLEELLKQRAAEESEIQKIPSPGEEQPQTEPLTGRLRLPPSQKVPTLRISQDREIDPDQYIVGPGDVLQLYIWGEFDLSYQLQVDPEGTVVIPTIGALNVSDMTLSQARASIHSQAETKYPGVDITVTLAGMRFFTVYATGAIVDEGSQVVHPTARVTDLIDQAGGFISDLRGTIEEEVNGKTVTRVKQLRRGPVSRRAIELRHSNGAVEYVDLDMYHATGDVRYNPYLQMGDVVHVCYRHSEYSVYGAVNQTGLQEYRPGDTLGDLITLAGGIKGTAPIDQVQLWRFVAGTDSTISLDLLGGTASATTLDSILDTPMQNGDMVFLRTRSDWQLAPTVHVYGQVRYSGPYRIIPGVSRIRDAIEAAGGFIENASLADATMIRMKARRETDPELKRLRKLQAVSGLADMSPEDRAYLKTKARERAGLVAVDFVRLFEQHDEEQNLLLEGGDVIFVPEARHTITLSGQIRQPGLVTYVPGATVGYYLDRAGGFAWRANRRGARLIRAHTGIRMGLRRDLEPKPGDEIWVPEKQYRDWWAFTQSTMRTLAESLTLIYLVRSL